MYSCSSVGQPGGSFHSSIKREGATTQSWEGKDLRHLENIAIRSHDLWSHLPRPTCAVILLPIIPSFPPSFLPSFHNTRSPSCYSKAFKDSLKNPISIDFIVPRGGRHDAYLVKEFQEALDIRLSLTISCNFALGKAVPRRGTFTHITGVTP